MRYRIMAMLPLLVLAACGGKAGGGNESSGASAQVQEQTPANMQDDPQNSAVPLTTPQGMPAATPSPVAQLPTAFQGRWGMTDQDCVPTSKDPKGLMIVSADGLGFGASRGALQAIHSTTPGTLVVDIEFTGEGGDQWLRRETLSMLDDGRTLVRQEQNPPGSFRYSRCPAGKETSA